MVTKTEAIKNFLLSKTHNDLAIMYSHDMECQVNVAQGNGERIDGEFNGRRWHGWSDGVTTWKSFRIPYKANTEPEYNDAKINFDLAVHAESIGMTGWDWKNRCSKWVAFDFDALVGHSDKHAKKLSNTELEDVKQAAFDIDWVSVRKSTSGSGLHLYVFLDNIPTANHNEHAALGRAILGRMSAVAGYDFASKVDICGGNMWVWHRKMEGTDGLVLLKSGNILYDIPPNWRDHINVVDGKRRKNLPKNIETHDLTDFDELCGQYPRVQLDEDHKRMIKYLEEHNLLWWWDQDRYMLVTHTLNIKDAFTALGLKGFFDTNSKGTNRNEQNCFLFPIRKGAWSVRRFSQGCAEHESWCQDNSGWTMCYLNREPDLKTACKAMGGLEDTKGGFVFKEAEVAASAARLLGVNIDVAPLFSPRRTVLRQHKDGRLIIEIDYNNGENTEAMPGWLIQKDKLVKIAGGKISGSTSEDVNSYDDFVRHLVTVQGEDYGWVIKRDGYWGIEPIANIKLGFGSMGVSPKEIVTILGNNVLRPWRLVNKPFQPEYPGDREWNRDGAQLKYYPDMSKDELSHPHWSKILNHCGHGLNSAVKKNAWCRANGIITGADYLKCWVASLFQYPLEPLPFLFLYSTEQNTGKSFFYEAISTLMTKGYVQANAALEKNSNFNKELEGMLLCVIEEIDLQSNKTAYNKIKNWVTGLDILIHEKFQTPYHVPNTTHWIQCANDHRYCPIFPGDTRITMIKVDCLDPLDMIPKPKMLSLLERESVDFITAMMRLEIPESNDRLRVPVIDSEEKEIVQQYNTSVLDTFLSERCKEAPGHSIMLSELYEVFLEWVDKSEINNWTKIRFGREIPPSFIKGRSRTNNQVYIGNIAYIDTEIGDVKQRYVLADKNLVLEDIDD